MRQPKPTPPENSARQARKRGLSPLFATSIILLMLAGGTVTWLQLSGPPMVAEEGSAVVVKLSPPVSAAAHVEAERGASDSSGPTAPALPPEVSPAPAAAEEAKPPARAEVKSAAPVAPPGLAPVLSESERPKPPAPAKAESAAPLPSPETAPAPVAPKMPATIGDRKPNVPAPAEAGKPETVTPGEDGNPKAPAQAEIETLKTQSPVKPKSGEAAQPSASPPAATDTETTKLPPPEETAKLTPSPRPTTPLAKPVPPAAIEGLRPAPDPALVETTSLGPLPRVSTDGRKAWRVYARPFDSNDTRPRIAVIIIGLGRSGAATEAAIQRLPGPITLGFAPYANGLPQWIALARAAGHEVLLDVPMEPVNFPDDDPGPHALMTSLTEKENQVRLHWLLGRVTGYVGVVNRMGSRFTTSENHVRPVLKELEQRGLLFVDSRSSLRSIAARMASEVGLPNTVNNRFIDAEASRDAIDSRLGEIERIARSTGHAVGIGSAFPVTMDRLVHWAQTLDAKGLTLAPVSALVK